MIARPKECTLCGGPNPCWRAYNDYVFENICENCGTVLQTHEVLDMVLSRLVALEKRDAC